VGMDLHRPQSLVPLLVMAPTPVTKLQHHRSTAAMEAHVRRKLPAHLPPALAGFSAAILPTVGDESADVKLGSRFRHPLEYEPGIESEKSVTPMQVTSKSSVYRRFLQEIRARAVVAPGREDVRLEGLRTVPHPLVSSRKSSFSGASGVMPSLGRPISATSASRRSLTSRTSTFPDLSAASELHHHPAVTHRDGVKQGTFVSIRAQYKSSNANVPEVNTPMCRPIAESLQAVIEF
jgi:hypothetical protein